MLFCERELLFVLLIGGAVGEGLVLRWGGGAGDGRGGA